MAYSFDSLCSNIIPAGNYKAQVTNVRAKLAASGSNAILVTYTIMEGKYSKRTVVETIGEKAFSFRLMPLLKACHVDVAREFSTQEELFNYGAKTAVNSIIMIEIGINKYNGVEYNQVKSCYPVAESSATAEAVLDEFNDAPVMAGGMDMSALDKGTDEVPTLDIPAASEELTDPEIPEVQDDDLPF